MVTSLRVEGGECTIITSSPPVENWLGVCVYVSNLPVWFPFSNDFGEKQKSLTTRGRRKRTRCPHDRLVLRDNHLICYLGTQLSVVERG